MDPQLIGAARRAFEERFPGPAPRVVFAPGRVNLIGEHTDYNDGYVLPMAISRGIAVAFRPRTDRMIHAHSTSTAAGASFSLDALNTARGRDWAAYLAGVAWAFPSKGQGLRGLDLSIVADLPVGAGLSSSAALEVAMARALADAAALPWDPVEAAKLCQRAENEFVGMRCGLMDQFASAVSQMGCALLLDCRSLRYEPVAVPASAVVVVMDTGVRRKLATSAYNDRRAACIAAVAALGGVHSLRDVDRSTLEAARSRMSDEAFRRASHVIAENDRPVQMAEALRANDLRTAGALMNASHASLRDLYEVSCPELDLLTDVAREHDACFGARMTGAGFGGCAVALVDTGGATSFTRHVTEAYAAQSGQPTRAFVCAPEAGARLVD